MKLLILALLAWQVLGQAPGDFSPFCRTGEFEKNFPPEIEILMDTSDYILDLFGSSGSPWVQRDIDGDATNWEIGGGSCEAISSAHGFEAQAQPQNNWLFSQHIRYNGAIEVFINISLDLSLCTQEPNCVNRFVNLYQFDTNPVDSSERVDPDNYRLVQRLTQRVERLGERFTISLVRPQSGTSGFYLGFQDVGTRGQISRVIVFFKVARGREEDLLSCPDVSLPVQGSTSQESCSCVDTASSAGDSLVRHCSADGVCNEDQVCACRPGFQLQEVNGVGSCTACPEGTYKADVSNSSCSVCPMNSESRGTNNTICACFPFTMRHSGRPEDPCGMPPSSPRLLFGGSGALRVAQNSISVCWLPALDNGGLDDLRYNIYLYDTSVDNPEFVKANDEGIFQDGEGSDATTCYDAELPGNSDYGVLVVSTNGATGDPQTITDVDTIQGRYVAFLVSSTPCSNNAAAGVAVTFFVTLLVTAAITAVVVVLVMMFLVPKRCLGHHQGSDKVKYNTEHKSYTSTPKVADSEKTVHLEKARRPPPPPTAATARKPPPPPRPPNKPLNA